MLVLTRREGERILFLKDGKLWGYIQLCHLELEGHQCRIGVQLPNEIEIRRESRQEFRLRQDRQEGSKDEL